MEKIKNELFTTNYTEVNADNFAYNAYHDFYVNNAKSGQQLCHVHFQEGSIKEVGINGVNNEDLLLMVMTRLENFQNSEYACEENQLALDHLTSAVKALRERTNKRAARGVEGTSEV